MPELHGGYWVKILKVWPFHRYSKKVTKTFLFWQILELVFILFMNEDKCSTLAFDTGNANLQEVMNGMQGFKVFPLNSFDLFFLLTYVR